MPSFFSIAAAGVSSQRPHRKRSTLNFFVLNASHDVFFFFSDSLTMPSFFSIAAAGVSSQRPQRKRSTLNFFVLNASHDVFFLRLFRIL